MNEIPAALVAATLAALAFSARSAAEETAAGAERAAVEARPAMLDLWEASRASGAWRTDFFSSSRSLDDRSGVTGTTLELEALPQLTTDMEGKIDLRAMYSSVGTGSRIGMRLREGYVRVRLDRVDLTLGKQIVAWGRADGLNPTDNLTPRDFTALLPFEDDQRFGTLAAKLDVFLSRTHTLTVFATPFFEASRIPLPSTQPAVRRSEPAHTLANSSLGVRLNRTGEGFDASISYYRGHALLPTARLTSDGQEGAGLRLGYDRITVIGADFARNFGRFGLRGEAAYIDTADDAGADPATPNPYLYWIAGIDRTFGENLNVNLQFVQRRVRHFRNAEALPDPAVRSAALQNALVHGQQDAVGNGVTFRISEKWMNQTLEAEIFAAIDLTRDNSFLRPLVTYAFNDRWKGTLGGEAYLGAEDTRYGSLKMNRTFFAELRYGF